MATGLGIRGNGPREQSIIDPSTGKSKIMMGDLEFPPRKVWIKTFGCQMNYHDSDRIKAHLENLNFSSTEELEEADLVLFNTCAVRDLANNKFYSQLGEIKHAKKKKNGLVVGIGGCVAQTEGEELVKKYKHLDFAFGTDVIDTINDMVFRVYAGDSKFSINSWDRSENFSIETKVSGDSPCAFVNIIKGCNKYCTYCIVPYTRGKEKSRLIDEIVIDVVKLVKYQGIQEVTLLGQNVNSFGKENDESLAMLISKLDEIDGLEIIRYTTSHPYDVSDDLIAIHGSSKKLSKHLHLPVQSGSESVLQRMHREYTPKHFLTLLEKLRIAQPEIVISSDIIAGFVNETEEEHQETLNFLNLAQFDFIYSYVYSKRNKTRAALLEDNLSDEIRGKRLRQIQAQQMMIQDKIRQTMIGKIFRILVEGDGHMGGVKKWKGRTNCNRIVHFRPLDDQKDYKWHWVEVKITSATALSCQGDLVLDLGKKAPTSSETIPLLQ